MARKVLSKPGKAELVSKSVRGLSRNYPKSLCLEACPRL